jgi:tetratricopeptide (TPR) repeat protein
MLRFSWLLPLVIATTAHAQPDRRTQALQLFEQSDKAYKAGKFEDAAVLLRKAYGIYPEPTLLYNLGRALEGMGDAKGAVEAYEHYLHVAKHVDDRAAIERRIATLKANLEKQQEAEQAEQQAEQTPPPPALPPQPPPQPAPPPPPVFVDELDVPATVGWVAVGTGGALLATGGLFGWRASANHDDAVNEPMQTRAADLQSTAQHDATIANVLFIAGGAIAIGGGIYELLHQRSEEAGPQLTVSGHSVSVRWAW